MMVDHPIQLFVFCLANVVSAVAFAAIAAGIIARSGFVSRWVKGAGIAFAGASSLAHLGLALNVLFNADITAGQASSNPVILLLHTMIAVSVWAFLIGIFLQVGRWGEMPSPYPDFDDFSSPFDDPPPS